MAYKKVHQFMGSKTQAIVMTIVATVTVLTTGFGAFGPMVAGAQPAPLSLSPAQDPLVEASRNPQLARALQDAYEAAHRGQPGYVQVPPVYFRPNPYPAASLRDYAAPRLAKREPDGYEPNVERLFVESPAMRRVVQVQVQYAKDRSKPAPMLYLLDGAASNDTSSWLTEGKVQQLHHDAQVTVVMPTEARSSNYANWQADDPMLGRLQWETFLTRELPTVLEKEADLKFNGARYLGGASMGAGAAVRLASLYPDRYRGTFGLSGCYSTTSNMGREFLNMIVAAGAGNPHNQWGPGTSAERLRNDVTAHPEGLKNMRVYVFTADGVITPRDRSITAKYGPVGNAAIPSSVVLEKMSNECAHELDDAMRARGMTHQKITYQQGGIHFWSYFAEQLPIAWQHMSQ